MSFYEEVIALLGPVPAGYEPVAFVVVAVVFLYVLTSAFSILAAVLNWIGGR